MTCTFIDDCFSKLRNITLKILLPFNYEDACFRYRVPHDDVLNKLNKSNQIRGTNKQTLSSTNIETRLKFFAPLPHFYRL